ncbi:MAG TPA: hypothetical protein VMU64_06790 [Acidimicrobiales bacterium]|nr:hypothetical protein [Acidimicrobiales bacterium]
MKHNLGRRMTAGAVAASAVVGLVVMVPGAASAAPSTTTTNGSTTAATQASSPRCTPTTFRSAQQVVEADLAGRVAQLNALSAAANNAANHLTTGDRQTLQNDITRVELPGIQALQTQAQSAVTCAGLRAVAYSMVYNYRVYVVMTPQTRLTVVLDDETYIEGVLVHLEPQIATAISNAQAAGKDVTAAQAAFNDFKSQVSTAQSATNGESTQMLAQTPYGFPGNWQVFLAGRTDATNARVDLHAAYADAERIRTDLQ